MSGLRGLGHRLYTGEVQFDFVGRKRTWYAISGLIILVAALALVFRGLNFGIEFKGGAEFRVPNAQCSIEGARSAVEQTVTGEVIVQSLNNGEIRVQTQAIAGSQADEVLDALSSECKVAVDEINSQLIGPTWGAEVTKKALTGLVVFLALVVVFIAVMFEFKMAIAAIVALLHDIVITVGAYALVGFDVTPATMIGLLTILGYSLYDTVVVFDSVRENTAGIVAGNQMTYSEAANLSINQTLVRSINTSVIALLPVGAILFVGAGLLGAGTLKDLALVLFVGIAASTYSSIFVATPLLADLKEREPAMQALAKRVNARRTGQPVGASARRAAATRSKTAVAEPEPAPSEEVVDDVEGVDEPAAPTPTSTARPASSPAGPRNQPRKSSNAKRRPSGKKRR
jgi:preprotein translocase subunit SecF